LFKKSKKKVGRVVRRTLADGTVKEYRYAAYKAEAPRVVRDSVEALIRAFQASPEWRALKKATQESYTTYLKPLRKVGHLHVKNLSRRDILEIRDAIAGARGNGAATAFMRSTSAMLTWAVDKGWINTSPAHKIRRLSGGSLRAWTAEDATTALAGLPEYLRRAVVLGLYTGQRRGDLCAAKWDDYDGTDIKFIQQKTGETVILEVHPDLKAELDEWAKTKTAETILTDVKGRTWNANKLSVVLPLALQELGLPKGLNVHGMRKLFATEIAEGGGTPHQIAANTGHKTLAMVQLYTASVDQRKLARQGMAKIQKSYKPGKSE
jgi:integrase